ncbi:PLDc N-terminal domain-containing protein [Methylohalobius crimeensis]|uniref:PLDc N-terminal domain-containing protein n=1 Tax=Methylohalobius crimeensis TaxID=244365 RepID=UPI0003B7A9DA|nr:PLDc N-terminal domain-containing protein [Methylohalobius crimeensis]
MDIEVGGLLGLVLLILDVWAIIKVIQSSADIGIKVLWVVVILVLPVIGLVLWFFLGPKG